MRCNHCRNGTFEAFAALAAFAEIADTTQMYSQRENTPIKCIQIKRGGFQLLLTLEIDI